MITKREITEALALSCVESYFLAWLAKRFDVSKLYGESFVPIGQVFDDFAQGAKYEAYEGVPRIQETAEKAGSPRTSIPSFRWACPDRGRNWRNV